MSQRSIVDIIRVVQAVQEAKKRIGQPQRPGVTYFSVQDVWLYQAVMDAKVCDLCRKYETSKQWNGNQIRSEFPYLEIIDENTIKTHTHMPRDDNCRCYLVRSIGYEEPTIDLYPKIKISRTIPEHKDIENRLHGYLQKLPEKHLDKLQTLRVKKKLFVRGYRVGGAYYRDQDKIELDYYNIVGEEGKHAQGIIYHEVGHHVYDDILSESQKEGWQTKYNLGWKNAMPNGYAKTNANEGFAECYAKYMKGESLPGDIQWWFKQNV